MFWALSLGIVLLSQEVTARAGPLTHAENQHLQSTCGIMPQPIQHKGYLTEDATTKMAPWSVAIMADDSQQHCSGVLISPRHVVTAAHCAMGHNFTVPKEVESMYFLIDDDCGKERGGCKLVPTFNTRATKVFVPRDYMHPKRSKYGPSQYGDIAVYELAEEVNFKNTSAVPACLADFKAPVGTEVHHYGYGDDPNNRTRAGSLQHLKTTVAACDDYESKFTTDLDHLCTFSKSHPCSGDSGGGFIGDVKGKKTVVGLVSWGDFCYRYKKYPNQKELLDHNVAIAAHTKWICEKTGICLGESPYGNERFYNGDILTIYNDEIY